MPAKIETWSSRKRKRVAFLQILAQHVKVQQESSWKKNDAVGEHTHSWTAGSLAMSNERRWRRSLRCKWTSCGESLVAAATM
eukprot:3338583-Prorocentrum_lima.AAC.1